MYADRHARRMKLDPGSLGLSAAMVGVMMAGLIFSTPDFVAKIKDKGLRIVNVKVTPIPPPDEIKPLPKTQSDLKPKETLFTPAREVETAQHSDNTAATTTEIPTTPFDGTGTSLGSGEILTKPVPVIVAPGVNPRFNYQPDYPANERRLGHEGRVVVRVLVGTDGRVKEVEKISAASDAFFEATRRRALEKWRLTPGTKDGVPIEAWRQMSVSFVMNDE